MISKEPQKLFSCGLNGSSVTLTLHIKFGQIWRPYLFCNPMLLQKVNSVISFIYMFY
jgi:hypothetical protein